MYTCGNTVTDFVKEYGGDQGGEYAGVIQIEKQRKKDGSPRRDLHPTEIQTAARKNAGFR